MATTTNYGWTTPDDTDLVKDGASAIRSLGTSVDTTTKALNPSTTLGDIEYRSSTANTNTRLGIGTTGQVLTVAGGVPAWGTAASGAGLTLVKSQVIGSAVSSVTVTSAFSATYDAYAIFVTGGTGSVDDENVTLQLGSTTTGYYAIYIGATFSTAVATIAANDNGSIFTRAGNVITNGTQCSFEIINPFLAKRTYIKNGLYGGDSQYRNWGGYVDTTTSYTAFTLTPVSGTLTGGTIFVYGYALS